jgi:hypothetical protein
MNKCRPAEAYHGRDGYHGCLVTADSQRLDPWHSRCVIDYGSEEFGWGECEGCREGAKQLAMAMLLQETASASMALALHMRLYDQVIVKLPAIRWTLEGDVLRDWILRELRKAGRAWPWKDN